MATAILSLEVWKWPEFLALCDRLGIPNDPRTTAITIRVAVDEVVKVIHEHHASDAASLEVPKPFVVGRFGE